MVISETWGHNFNNWFELLGLVDSLFSRKDLGEASLEQRSLNMTYAQNMGVIPLFCLCGVIIAEQLTSNPVTRSQHRSAEHNTQDGG